MNKKKEKPPRFHGGRITKGEIDLWQKQADKLTGGNVWMFVRQAANEAAKKT